MLIEARELAAARGGRTVRGGVGFRLAPGGALLLTGPNGAGKTTLLRTVAGLLAPAAGTLLVDGAPALADPAAHGRRLAFLGHADAIKPGLTGRENLRLAAGGDDGAILASLAAMGLAPLADTPAATLSAGQRRRLALARALLPGRPLLILDEPATALDDRALALLGAALTRHLADGGLLLASTHAALPLAHADTLALA